MFWRNFGFRHASGIDQLLDRGDDVALEAILDDDDLLNECKSQNTRLIEYIRRVPNLRKLLSYACGQIEGEGMGKYKYPHVATEVLCSDIWAIVETCLQEADQLLVPFWDAVLGLSNQELQQKPLIGPHFTKITTVFMSKKPDEMFAFISAQPSVLDRLLGHIEIPAFVDLIFRLIQLEDMPGASGIMEWLSHENLIPKLASMLSPQHHPDLHPVVSDLLKGIIALCAPSPNSANDQIALVANRFSRQLASKEISHMLVGYMLDDVPDDVIMPENSPHGPPDTLPAHFPQHRSSLPDWPREGMDPETSSSSSSTESEYHSVTSSPSERSTSSLLHVATVIIELMRKNNSDFFEPYLFHTIRQRLIQIQQQYLPQLDRTGMDPEKRAEDDRNILERTMGDMVDQMGIVHFGPLLAALTLRLNEFQTLLSSPRSSTAPIDTSAGPITPLTAERFRICELYAELLHCSSLSLLNRTAAYGPSYDDEGRLSGGLGGLEALARVISNQGNEPQGEETPPRQRSRSRSRSRSPSPEPDDSPVASRDTLSSSIRSGDHSSRSSEHSSEGDIDLMSNPNESDDDHDVERRNAHSGSDNEDLGPMVEITVHDDEYSPDDGHLEDTPEELAIPHSPQPSHEQLPPAPFAVPSPRARPPPLPDVKNSYEETTTAALVNDLSPPSSSNPLPPPIETQVIDIDPFADPNDIPPSPPPIEAAASLADSLLSSPSLDNSRLLNTLEGSTAPSTTVLPARDTPIGDVFKSQLLQLNVLSTILGLFFGFPMNNFLHNVVYDFLHQLMTGRVDRGLNRELVISLFRDAKLLHRIIEAQTLSDQATSNPKGVRLGYMGHLTLISEDVISALALYPPDLRAMLAQYAPQPAWDAYVSGRFRETKEQDSSQLGGGKPSLLAAGRSASVPTTVAVDEADHIAPQSQPGHVAGNRLMDESAIGASPSPRHVVQNVVFAAINEDDEDEALGSNMDPPEQSAQFANYLSEQISGSNNGHFSSPNSSDNSDDDEEAMDGRWRTEHLDVSSRGHASDSSMGMPLSRQPAATFDDSFGDFSSPGSPSRDPFGESDGFGDVVTPQVVQNNFTSDFSNEFTFPPLTSEVTALFSLDDEFADAPMISSASSGFSFSTGGFDDDEFGDFQGGGLEVVMSTNPDGTVVESESPASESDHDSQSPPNGILSTDDSTVSPHDSEPSDEDGDVTPKASKALFDEPPAALESPTHQGPDISMDFLAFQRDRSTLSDDPHASDSTNRSNALAILERSFGRVSVSDDGQDVLGQELSEAMVDAHPEISEDLLNDSHNPEVN